METENILIYLNENRSVCQCDITSDGGVYVATPNEKAFALCAVIGGLVMNAVKNAQVNLTPMEIYFMSLGSTDYSIIEPKHFPAADRTLIWSL